MPTITLTTGNDTTLLSGQVDDGLVTTIVALEGDDTVLGGGGSLTDLQEDLIYGGEGSDSLSGGFGANTVFGNNGDDFLDNRTVTSSDGIDTIYGGDGADSIFGKQADDLIYGGDGDDTISSNQAVLSAAGGLLGIGDTVYGGDGDDVITTLDPTGTDPSDSSSIGDLVYGGAGNDSILGALENPNDATFPQIDNDLLFGGEGSDIIDGNGGTDSIDGGLGDDTVIARDDADTTTGGDGIDTIDFSGDSGSVTFDMDSGATTVTGPTGTDIESNVSYENVIGTSGDDTIIGSSTVTAGDVNSTINNVIYAGDGADSLTGGFGSDTFFTGAGSDSIDGSEDADGLDIDVLDYSDEADGVIVNYSGDEAGTAQGTSTGTDTFVNIERIIFTGNTDVVDAGNDTVGVTLDTGAGNDFVTAGQAADSLDGGDGTSDTLSYFGSAAPVVLDVASGTGTGGDAEGDEFQNFENFQLSGGGDNFNGGTGEETVDAGAGNDNVAGGAGADSLDGGDGDGDTLDYSGSAAPVTVDLAAQTVAGGDAEGDVIANFEGATGSTGDDDLTGDDDANDLDGNDGNDTLDGAGGDDSVDGGAGDDDIDGGTGNDTLDGGTGNDTIDGGEGDDTVIGADVSDGNDFIIGDGNDVVDGGGNSINVDPDPANHTPGDFDTLSVQTPEGGSFVVVPDPADPTNPESGTVEIYDGPNGTGNLVSTITFTEIEAIVCFTRGTMIETPSGEVAIEDLAEGDLVMTRDNGAQPIRWIGSKATQAEGKLAPVVIKAGALGNDRDIKVSQLHRMLITDWRAELMFDETEVLACAKHLVNGDSIFVAEGGTVEYFHMLFDNHEIVTANGALSESFHPGEQGLGWLEEEMREEIFAIFPELRAEANSYGPAARASLKAFEARALKR